MMKMMFRRRNVQRETMAANLRTFQIRSASSFGKIFDGIHNLKSWRHSTNQPVSMMDSGDYMTMFQVKTPKFSDVLAFMVPENVTI